jgi:hypothetical protein
MPIQRISVVRKWVRKNEKERKEKDRKEKERKDYLPRITRMATDKDASTARRETV